MNRKNGDKRKGETCKIKGLGRKRRVGGREERREGGREENLIKGRR